MILGLCWHCLNTKIFLFAQFQKVCQKVWLSSKSMPVYFTLKKCSTQYVAHFMWVTNSLKIGEYATICSTLYVLPYLTSLYRPHIYNKGGWRSLKGQGSISEKILFQTFIRFSKLSKQCLIMSVFWKSGFESLGREHNIFSIFTSRVAAWS